MEQKLSRKERHKKRASKLKRQIQLIKALKYLMKIVFEFLIGKLLMNLFKF